MSKVFNLSVVGPTGYYYSLFQVISPEDIEFLRQFIIDHSQLLKNPALTVGTRCLVDTHRDFLTMLGDGNPFVGLERAGVADWIKEGKDPGEEWQKKYPSKNP